MFLFAGWVSHAKANNYLCWSPVTPALPCWPANNNELRQQMAMNGRRGHLAVVMDYIMCNHAHCPLCHGDALFWSSSSALNQSNGIPIFMATMDFIIFGNQSWWLSSSWWTYTRGRTSCGCDQGALHRELTTPLCWTSDMVNIQLLEYPIPELCPPLFSSVTKFWNNVTPCYLAAKNLWNWYNCFTSFFSSGEASTPCYYWEGAYFWN